MSIKTVPFGQIAALTIVLSLGLPIPSQALTFWEDDFENHLSPNWDTSSCGSTRPLDGCNASISAGEWHKSGINSLRSYYPTAGVQAGTFYDRTHPSSAHVWMRFYFYTVGFVYDPVQTKLLFNKTPTGGAFMIWGSVQGRRDLVVETQLPVATYCPTTNRVDIACNYLPNKNNVPLNDNTVYCIETHAYNGTPGQANGIIEAFINGNQTMGHYNVAMLAASISPTLGAFRQVTHYTQHGKGLRYIDDLAVGDTRIGCGSTPVGDVAPPAPPTGLAVIN